jgi:pimeloyl-ACP methyl ester carboxylesterase
MPVHPDLLTAARDDLPAAAALIAKWGHSDSARAEPAMPAATRHLLERSPPGVLHADLAACDAYADGAAHAATVACPAVLVLGAEDRMTPAKAGRKLAASVTGAQVVELAGVGHMMLAEAPAGTQDALAATF